MKGSYSGWKQATPGSNSNQYPKKVLVKVTVILKDSIDAYLFSFLLLTDLKIV